MRCVRTGSRLHWGPLNWPGSDDPRPDFGGLGLMVDAFATVVLAEPADRWNETITSRASLHRAVADRQPQTVAIERTAPPHRGLGSGTQRELAVAVAAGLPVEAESLAAATGRGVRSAIGLHGFCRGGLILDAGRDTGEAIGRLHTRIDFPDWPLLLVRLTDEPAVSGPAEREHFARLPPMPAEVRRRLRHDAETILAAAAERDLDRFAASLTRFGRGVGDFFAPVQGGPFGDARWLSLGPKLEAAGCGYAQSSWGPTVAVVGDLTAARTILAGAADLQTVAARNVGASIQSSTETTTEATAEADR